MTVGQAWTFTLADSFKIWAGLVMPGLLLAAIIESRITPGVVAAVLGGG